MNEYLHMSSWNIALHLNKDQWCNAKLFSKCESCNLMSIEVCWSNRPLVIIHSTQNKKIKKTQLTICMHVLTKAL